ncbi:hypothetical protein JXO52_17305 [bacterium]|nr:hypothetical protein [bacterium]
MRRHLVMLCLMILTGTVRAQFNLYLEQQLPLRTRQVTAMQISKDGRFLACGTEEGGIIIRDIGAGRTIRTLDAHRSAVRSLLFDKGSQRLLAAGDDGRVTVWDLYSGAGELEIRDFGSRIREIALSPDDRMLAAAGDRKEVYVWEFPAGRLKATLKGHKKAVIAAAFSSDGDQLFSIGEDRQMIVWDVNTLEPVRKNSIEARTISGSGIDIKSADFSADRSFAGIGIEEHILAKGGRGMIFKYNLTFIGWNTGAEIETLQGNRKNIDFFLISPDRKYAVTDNSTLQNNRISFWNIENGVIEQNYPVSGALTALAIAENGRWLAGAYHDAVDNRLCHVDIWQISGMQGYERFATGQKLDVKENRGFGASIKITTPTEPLIGQGARRRLAVMSFDSRGLEDDVALTTSYLLESKLGNSSAVELIERNQIDKVLEELKYQQTGLTTSDAAAVGQQLNAEYILIGSINKLGNLLIITVKLVNVETSQIEGTREVQCANATIETISDMVAALAPTIVK